MTTPERRAEASAASATFQVAMATLGSYASAKVMQQWAGVIPMPGRVTSTGDAFFEEAYATVATYRHQAQVIAIAYLRLYRALLTDYTFQPIIHTDGPPDTIDSLRSEFVAVVQRWTPQALKNSLIPDSNPLDAVDDSHIIENPDSSVYTPYAPGATQFEISQEEIKDLEGLLDSEELRADGEARGVLGNLGAKRLELRIQQLKDKLREAKTGADIDRLREELHAIVGGGVARHASRLVQNGGRFTVSETARADPRAIAFVRVHYPEKDPLPCGFCALLISKGLEYRAYGSEVSASTTKANSHAREKWGAEMCEYHPECHCVAVAVYSQEEYDEDRRFDINRDLLKLYKAEFSNMTQWRQLMRTRAAQAAGG